MAKAEPHRLLVPALVFIGIVVAFGGSLGAPLVPLVAHVDHVSVDSAQWSLTITFLISAVATPVMGRLGDGPHRREVILGGLAIVAAGGVLAALPLGFAPLLVGRAMQGVGLGLTPMTLALARDMLPPDKARPALAVLSITTVAGVGVGYPVTAVIAERGGLHVAFWFGVCLAVAALVAGYFVVPSSRHHPAVRLDVAGAATLGLALAGLMLAISEGESWGWFSDVSLSMVAVSLLLLIGWVLIELRSTHPLVDIRLMRKVGVVTANVTGALTGVGMYLMMSTVTRLVQTPSSTGYGLGGSVAIAGLMLTPFSVGSVLASSVTRAMLRRMSPAAVLPIAAVLLAASDVLFVLARSEVWEIVVVMGVAGLGIGAIFAVMPGFIVRSVPLSETGSALSFNQVLRYVGYGIGSSASAAILEAHTSAGSAYPASHGYAIIGAAACAFWIITLVVTVVLPRLVHDAPASATALAGEDERAMGVDELEVEELESIASVLPYVEDDRTAADLSGPAPR
jgi:predicted MFS family arabinose efflux permease